MKKIIFLACLLLFVPQFAYSQISKSNPLGGNSYGDPFLGNNPSRVDINQQLLESGDAESLKVEQITNCTLRISNVTFGNGEILKPGGAIYEVNVPQNLNYENKKVLNFQILISTVNGSVPNAPFHLPKDWDKFDYSTSCNTPDGRVPTSNRSYSKTAKSVQEKINIQIGKPIVHNTYGSCKVRQ